MRIGPEVSPGYQQRRGSGSPRLLEFLVFSGCAKNPGTGKYLSCVESGLWEFY